jgi:hypothetical protein
VTVRALMRGSRPALVALLLPALVWAESAAPDAQVLGIADSVVKYCGPIDAAATERLRRMLKQLEQGASEQRLAEVRKSDEYREAYDSVAGFVGKVNPHDAWKFCSHALVVE